MHPRPSKTSSPLLLLAEHEPHIALVALTRLRWLAVVGQILAIAVALWALDLRLPILPVSAIILFTVVSNLALALWLKKHAAPPSLVLIVLILDVLTLSALLYFTDGAKNPFSVLFLVHVAMAVIALGAARTWLVVATVILCYGSLFFWYVPLHQRPIPQWLDAGGHWVSLLLVSVLLAVFIGHMERLLRQRDLELAQMREHATRNQRLASLTTLAAGAAHELNTPLGTIALVARELEVATEHSPELQSLCEDSRLIRSEVDRCRNILARMRGAIGDGDRGQIVDVVSLVNYVREQLRPEEAARLNVECSPLVKQAAAPARALEQAILVLLRNAFEASASQSPVTLSVALKDSKVLFEVRDIGAGMSPEQLRRAGEPFFTTKEPGKGMGLGLFLVRLVAERCGAHFHIHSKIGLGTHCVLELPARNSNNDAQPDSATRQ